MQYNRFVNCGFTNRETSHLPSSNEMYHTRRDFRQIKADWREMYHTRRDCAQPAGPGLPYSTYYQTYMSEPHHARQFSKAPTYRIVHQRQSCRRDHAGAIMQARTSHVQAINTRALHSEHSDTFDFSWRMGCWYTLARKPMRTSRSHQEPHARRFECDGLPQAEGR